LYSQFFAISSSSSIFGCLFIHLFYTEIFYTLSTIS
jgi:hypothetical protein